MKNKGLNPSRRKFLAAAAKYSAVAAALGLSRVRQVKGSTAELTGEEKVRFDLLQNAIETGNMESALEKFGAAANLKPQMTRALRSLTSQDLKNLKAIQNKLAPFGGRFATRW